MGKRQKGAILGALRWSRRRPQPCLRDDLRKMITDGKGHMPKFAGKLTGDEIDLLVQQIQAANKK